MIRGTLGASQGTPQSFGGDVPLGQTPGPPVRHFVKLIREGAVSRSRQALRAATPICFHYFQQNIFLWMARLVTWAARRAADPSAPED
ncbi:hypothetical protein NDU88_001141 [Pleurodeles waltl]|uniref:Uncharacterized protein n=1 Tax=Pleurodeles waltl TaxID=8319 RepID=A0AAV7MLT8_PLEWA|nr:hypothetical protein NDU88_001141 [Pleurodeles waltl]